MLKGVKDSLCCVYHKIKTKITSSILYNILSFNQEKFSVLIILRLLL